MMATEPESETEQSLNDAPVPAPKRGGRLGAGLRAIGWYVREFFGDTAYDKYLARHRVSHCAPDLPPLSRREFYRRLTDEGRITGCC
jgi:uncharacterized short protein YbdD (DUF466 family)